MRTHFKPTETLQCTHLNTCHLTGVKKGFVKGEALSLVRRNYFKEVKHKKKEALKQKLRTQKIPTFVTQFQPSFPNLKNMLMDKWHLIQTQPWLREIFKEPPLFSHRKEKSLKDMLVKKSFNVLGVERHNGRAQELYRSKKSRKLPGLMIYSC